MSFDASSEKQAEMQEALDRHLGFSGMDDEGNFPPLDPRWQRYVSEDGWIRHPLYHSLYMPALNKHINEALEVKTREVEELKKRHEWWPIIFVYYERPYRLDTFIEIMSRLTDKEYWQLLGDIWTDSENIWQNVGQWRAVLSSKRKRRFEMMSGDDLAYYRKKLPDEFEVFRGSPAPDQMGCGMAWTLSETKARWFANRWSQNGLVYRGTAHKHNAIAFFDGRSEAEIVIFPENVYDLETLKP